MGERQLSSVETGFSQPPPYDSGEIRDPTIAELRQLVVEGIQNNPYLTSRLEKAAFLVLLRQIERLAEDSYLVGAEDGLRTYEINNGHCECHDYLRHGTGHGCKHRLALKIHLELFGDTRLSSRLKTNRDMDLGGLSLAESARIDQL